METKIAHLTSGECTLVGPENVLIPEGIYTASYLRFETSSMYSRKIPGKSRRRSGGKLYIWFTIDPYNESLQAARNTELYIAYNLYTVELPAGRNGKFSATRKGDYYKDYKRLIGAPARADRISPRAYQNKLWRVEVGTVKEHDKQRRNHITEPYSVIRRIINETG